jgi:DNA-binding GntR family transcriptional regulator
VIYPGQSRIDTSALLALHLRTEITEGRLRPGQRLPSERDLGQMFGLARGTVAKAVYELRRMGVVDYVRGYGVVVREPRDIEYVQLEPGSKIEARPSTTEEQEEWGEGVSALVLHRPDGTGDVYPGDRTVFYA